MSVDSTIEPAVPVAAPVAVRGIPAVPKNHHAGLDRFGAFLGLACAVHCIVVPLALGVLPTLGLGFIADHGFDHAIVAVAIAAATLAAWLGWRSHGHRPIIATFAVAVAMLIASHAVTEESTLAGRAMSVVGGVTLAVAHFWNTRRTRRCAIPDHRH